MAPALLAAQRDSLPLNRDFRFADGLYLSFEALRNNQPDLRTEVLDGRMVALPEEYSLKVERLFPKGRPDIAIPHGQMYALVFDGIPYRLTHTDTLRGYSEFSGLRVRGQLSYFEFDTLLVEERLITAYVPQTGRPFRQGVIQRESPATVQRVLDFASGEEWPLTRERLLARTQNDPALKQAIETLPEDAGLDMLYRCLLIYDDRHPLYLPATTP
jgi:hypothetical protein